MWLKDKIDSFLGVPKVQDPIGRKKMKNSYFCRDCYINEYWFKQVKHMALDACPKCGKYMIVKFKNLSEDAKDKALVIHRIMWKEKFGKFPW